MEKFKDLRGRRVTVLGLGLFGGGVEAARFLSSEGARVRVVDARGAEPLAPSLKALEGLGIEFLLGSDDPDRLEGSDLAILNPAFKPSHPAVRYLRDRAIPWDLEIGLFLRRSPARILAVTGTNGKSTTTSLLAHLLRKAQGERVFLGGNIGVSLLPELPRMTARDWVCLEISSAQLFYLADSLPPTAGAIVTNFTPDHQDWHSSLSEYAAAKQVLLKRQDKGGVAALNGDDPEVRGWKRGHPGRAYEFSLERPVPWGAWLRRDEIRFRDGPESALGSVKSFPLPGRHNLSNLLAASALLAASGVRLGDAGALAADFRPLEHRLEPAGTVDGAAFVNDSVSTTPEAALAGLAAFREPVVLLLGGKDKGLSFDALAREALGRCRAVIVYGAAGPGIEGAFDRARSGAENPATPRPPAADAAPPAQVLPAKNLAEALSRARGAARPGDVVLFSPACSSFDEFQNFAERGRRFKAWVREAGGPPP